MMTPHPYQTVTIRTSVHILSHPYLTRAAEVLYFIVYVHRVVRLGLEDKSRVQTSYLSAEARQPASQPATLSFSDPHEVGGILHHFAALSRVFH